MKRRTAGCQIAKLGPEQRENVLAWVLRTKATNQYEDLEWLLAYFHDGVVWGRQEAGIWRLSCETFPEISPRPRRDSLLELRLFGKQREILMWRDEESLSARSLVSEDIEGHAALQPMSESYLIRGDRILAAPRDGFTLLGDATGSQHAVPMACDEEDLRHGGPPLRLEVCHYLEQDPDTGVVRVSASRLVELSKSCKEKTS